MLLSAHQITSTTDRQEMVDGILRRSPQFRHIDVAMDNAAFHYRFNRATFGSVRIGVTSASSVRYAAEDAQDVALAMAFAGREAMASGTQTRHLQPVPTFLPRTAARGIVEHASFVTVRMSSARLREQLAAQDWRGDLNQWLDARWLTRLPDSEVVGSFLAYAIGRIDRYGQPGPTEARALEDLVYVHAAQLIMGDAGEPAAPQDLRAYRRCVDHIDQHLDAGVSVLDVAAVAGMSLRSVQLLFQRHAGVSMSQFILKRRLLKARDALLVATPDQRILDIALACGFNTISHFNRAYRDAFGETPRATMRPHR